LDATIFIWRSQRICVWPFRLLFYIELDGRHGRYGLPEALYLFMFIWLLVGFTGVLSFFGFGNVANTAHLVGMIAGFIIGLITKYRLKH